MPDTVIVRKWYQPILDGGHSVWFYIEHFSDDTATQVLAPVQFISKKHYRETIRATLASLSAEKFTIKYHKEHIPTIIAPVTITQYYDEYRLSIFNRIENSAFWESYVAFDSLGNCLIEAQESNNKIVRMITRDDQITDYPLTDDSVVEIVLKHS